MEDWVWGFGLGDWDGRQLRQGNERLGWETGLRAWVERLWVVRDWAGRLD